MADSPGSEEQLRFERLQRLLLDSGDIARFLVELAQLATTVIPDPVSCGTTLRYEHGLMTVGSSDHRAELLNETQYRNGGGPCIQSVRTGQTVEVPDLLLEERWPEYSADAVKTGLRCSVSFPLTLNGQTFGAMNVYGVGAPNLFGPQSHRELELFAAQAAGTLRVATRQVKDATLLAQMEESLRSRTVIDQALGIIMAGQRCTASAAFRAPAQRVAEQPPPSARRGRRPHRPDHGCATRAGEAVRRVLSSSPPRRCSVSSRVERVQGRA